MMQIEYGCVYKISSKPVMKGSRVETIEQARKGYERAKRRRLEENFYF